MWKVINFLIFMLPIRENPIEARKVIKYYSIYFSILIFIFLAFILLTFYILYFTHNNIIISVYIPFVLVLTLISLSIWVVYSRYFLYRSKIVALISGIGFSILFFSYAFWYLAINKAFHCSTNLACDSILTWIYYTIITIYTVGYGDITPVKNTAIIATIVLIIIYSIYVVFGVLIISHNVNENDQKIKKIIRLYKLFHYSNPK
jgi:hypothetical protein